MNFKTQNDYQAWLNKESGRLIGRTGRYIRPKLPHPGIGGKYPQPGIGGPKVMGWKSSPSFNGDGSVADAGYAPGSNIHNWQTLNPDRVSDFTNPNIKLPQPGIGGGKLPQPDMKPIGPKPMPGIGKPIIGFEDAMRQKKPTIPTPPMTNTGQRIPDVNRNPVKPPRRTFGTSNGYMM